MNLRSSNKPSGRTRPHLERVELSGGNGIDTDYLTCQVLRWPSPYLTSYIAIVVHDDNKKATGLHSR